MSNIIFLIGLPVGILGFLFLFWRRLKEDYTSSLIFSFSFLVILFMLIGFFIGLFLGNKFPISLIFNPYGLWFWLAFVFGCIGFVIGILWIKLKSFETLEATGIGFIFWFFAICLIGCLTTGDLKLLLFSILQGALIGLFFFLDGRYKSFNWYKSGKIGFAGLSVLGFFFLARSIVALINPGMLSFIGKFDVIVSCIVAFVFFVSLYNLSGF